MIFKENLIEILDGIRPFLLPLNSYKYSSPTFMNTNTHTNKKGGTGLTTTTP